MRKAWFIGLTAVMAVCFGMAQATAATRCVERTGAMGCSPTVQGAVGAAAPGDQIWVSPGVYYENVVVTTPSIKIQGGVYTAPTRRGVATWTPADPKLVIIDGRPDPTCADTGEAIRIDGAHHVTIANLTVRNAALDNIYSDGDYTTLDTVHCLSSEVWAGAYIEAHHATIRNSYFTANDYGVEIYGDNASVQNNTIYNHFSYAVYVNGLAPVVTGNRIHGTERYDAVYLQSAGNAVISNNTIRGGSESGVNIFGSDGCTVSNNDIRSCYSEGIYLDNCDGSAVTGNYIGGIDGEGIELNYNTAGNNVISNNTVEQVGRTGIRVDDLNTTISGNTVRNVFDNGEGVRAASDGGTISNNRVEGVKEYEGFYLLVDNMTISQNVAQFNSEEGFEIYGSNNTISNNTARHNAVDYVYCGGFRISGNSNNITGNLAEMNPGFGFYIYGGNTLAGNTATNNYRTGIYLRDTDGGNLLVNANVSTNNHGEGIANFASGVCSATNNIALGNRTDICDEGPFDVFTGNTFATGGWNVPCCLE